MLFRPEALLELREDMMLAISSSCRIIVLSHSFLRYRSNVIVKGVSNTIRIGYSITIIMESTVCALEAKFKSFCSFCI